MSTLTNKVLKPAPSVTSTSASGSTPVRKPVVPRGPIAAAACTACRKSKTRCCGTRPSCAVCVNKGRTCLYDTAGRGESRRQAIEREHDTLRREHVILQERNAELGREHAELQASSDSSIELLQVIRSSGRGKVDKIVRMVQAGISRDEILRRILDEGDPIYELSVAARARTAHEFPGLRNASSSLSEQSSNEEVDERVPDDVAGSILPPLSQRQSGPPPMYLEPRCSTTVRESRLDRYRFGPFTDSRNMVL